jgi:hypothetical protein
MAYRRLASTSLLTAGVLIAAAACGSRTGLFGPEGFELNADGGLEEAGLDATVGCTPGDFTFQLALTQLMFAIDRSGSMAFTLDGLPSFPRSQWRWSILQNSLAQTITTFDNQIAMGAKFFPEEITQDQATESEQACQLDSTIAIPPAQGNAQTILRVFDNSTPLGGTPTSEAIRVSADALSVSRSVARTIVLATDGAPNCNGGIDRNSCTCTSAIGQPSCNTSANGQFNCLDDTRTVETIRHTNQDLGIPVYVIGIGSTDRPDFLDVLDNMAVAGGRPRTTGTRKHYSANSQDELTTALETIRDSVSKCTYLTPSAPDDPDSITVKISGATVPRDPTQQNGWDWIDRRLGALQFFGAACTRAQSASTPTAVSGTIVCRDK